MKNYPNKFKKIVNHYLAESKFDVEYEDYYRNDFTRKALLFSICLNEIYGHWEEYSIEDIHNFQSFIQKFEKSNSTHFDEVECINLLESRIHGDRNL